MHRASQWNLAAAVGAAVAVVFGGAPALAGTPRTVSLTCRFDAPKLAPASDGYSVVTVGGCKTQARTGWPRLPFRTVRLLLPPGSALAGVAATPEANPVILDGAWRLDFGRRPLAGGRPPPGPTAAPDGPDPAVYQSSNRIPESRAELVSVQRMAGYDVAILRVFPLEYTPDAGRLVFTPALRVEVTVSKRTDTATSIGPRVASRARSRDRSRVGAFVDNPEILAEYEAPRSAAAAANPTGSDPFDYLLVTRQALLPAFQPMIERKIADGLLVHAETMENIATNYSGVDLAEKLRNCIRHAYTNGGVEYVLLGGDIATVPCRAAYGYCSGPDYSIPCDLYFACLDGTWNRDGDTRWGEPTDGDDGGDVDLLAEVYVGRAPVDTPEETAIFVSKVIAYETAGSARPFQAINAGEYLGAAGAQGGDALDRLLPPLSNGSFRVQWLDDRPYTAAKWTTADSLAALNQSPHLVFHQGHADEATVMRLDLSDLDALTNRTPFLFYSAGCDAGAFDNTFWDDCIGEELVKRNAGGAFAAILNSRTGWYDAQAEWRYSGEFQGAFLDQLLSQGNTTPGKAHQLAKQAMLGFVETSGDMPYRWCYFDLIFFGDPHSPIITPTVMGMSRPPDAAEATCTLNWNSLSNRLYSVYRATNMTSSGFVCLSSNLATTPPMNTYTDGVSGVDRAFYRVRVDP